MDDTEMARVQRYLREKFENQHIVLKGRPQSDGSVEVYLSDEFIGVLYKDDEDGDAVAAPKLSDDQRRTALILSVKDRRPANARHFGRQDLLDFQKGFDRKTYMEFKRRMNTKLESVTQKIRENTL